ncbi:uncharacterized protein N7483_000319 [Penicillium malachiteum]|uniref:uncharacterized protein n=1 Tax=Penicillium malachiteum TaxID=1324776 RepID=UPI002549872D|nr:uncharacterized protein N7483_000319 [Penicillium malachiteum]KAJ5735194.1 hypothetical protein N7483_000319 [Penicillium malachiteum]
MSTPSTSTLFAQEHLVATIGEVAYYVPNSPSHLESTFRDFAARDDVFQTGFIQEGLIIIPTESEISGDDPVPDDLKEFLDSHSTSLVFCQGLLDVPEGPYFVRGNHLRQAWRLYEDETLSFITTVIAHDQDSFRAQNETSSFVKELIVQGAVIVGKTKMSAYTGSEVPPEKTIDYLAPFNLRGDGYQGLSGSSSGAGSSIAAYDWVDISLGTDATGSISIPAVSYGVLGIRTTHSAFSLEGVMPSVPAFDTLGILARTSQEILNVYRAAGKIGSEYSKPTQIVYPTDFFPMKNDQQQHMIEEFLHALESYLEVEHRRISLAEEWTKGGPDDARTVPLDKYLEKSGYWPNFYDGHHVYDEFISGYQKRFSKKVYTSPFMTSCWNEVTNAIFDECERQLGNDITKEERDRGLQECEIFSPWIYSKVLTPEVIMLLPLGRPGANYRDSVGNATAGPPSTTFSPIYFSTIIGAPQVVVPVGQNPFESRVSGNIECAPIVVSLIGHKGADVTLLRVLKATLDYHDWPSEVLTGRNIFHFGNNARNLARNPSGLLPKV